MGMVSSGENRSCFVGVASNTGDLFVGVASSDAVLFLLVGVVDLESVFPGEGEGVWLLGG